jgi:RNA recognition motif-containing protein
MTRIFVSNLPASATHESIRALFARHGAVDDVALIHDRDTGQMRGIAYVEMPARDAICAVQNLNGHELDGCALHVNEARELPRHDGFKHRR